MKQEDIETIINAIKKKKYEDEDTSLSEKAQEIRRIIMEKKADEELRTQQNSIPKEQRE